MKILVTGGAGFIGSHLVAHLQEGGREIRVLDDFSTGRIAHLRDANYEVFAGSITDRRQVRAALRGIDTVFHLAALVSVPQSFLSPEEYYRVNVLGLRLVLEEACRAAVNRFTFASSASIYGSNPAIPTSESERPHPESPYAVSKCQGETLVQHYHTTGRLSTVTVRMFNVYGPNQDLDHAYSAAIPTLISAALQNKPLTVFGDGRQTRDFVYVGDAVRALAHLSFQSCLTGSFNVGNGQGVSIGRLVDEILALTRSASEVAHRKTRRGDPSSSIASVENLTRTGWSPIYGLQQGLALTIRSLRDPAPSARWTRPHTDPVGESLIHSGGLI